MNKSKISFYLIFIAFFTFIAIFLTIVQASYNNLMNPTKQVEADKFLEPLNPVLDSEIIQEIEKRQAPSDSDEVVIIDNSDSEPNKTISPVISVVPTNTAIDNNTQTVLIKEENN